MIKSNTSFNRAVKSAARELTHGLRKHALKNGWPEEVIRGIGIHHNGKEFKLHTSPAVEDLIWKHEYGDETSTPTAIIRKFFNDKSKLSEVVYRHYVRQNRRH